ncbi:Cyclic beta-(1,2)-glucan synthase NdvB [Pararobbsia alpina]|uniref:Cyclic beta-(1,2)-glucan synthase NdvB n=2 Tax=Pararobbsia alpina TaxID=621374 RepID=A0A6S7B210_9BURK|nr:Cyclic beta-(1,2)-glucan synthase NdvB [Pararobbsia alpina]
MDKFHLLRPFHSFRFSFVPSLVARFHTWRASNGVTDVEPLLRSELFSADQMEHHGQHLARQHRLSAASATDGLLARLSDNETMLASSCEMLTAATVSSRRPTPAAEWLLDNYYLIEDQIRTARQHLPEGYSRELPRLANGPSSGSPRVYDIALETISHGDGRVDIESLSRFIAAYQTITPLKLGELWAIPIMLRFALIENLRRVATRVMSDLKDRNLAVSWADRMTQTAELDPKSVVLTVADMARSDPPMASSFVAELARRLRGQSATLALPLTWIEQLLSESGLTIEHLVQIEAQQQATDQVSISNCIGSLRLLAAADWKEFVERMSVVEHVLRDDPAQVYGDMDFATRDHYRHVIERLSRNSAESEETVARAALGLATAAANAAASAAPPQDAGAPDKVQAHIGYYLVGRGLPELERKIAVRVTLSERWERELEDSPLSIYLGLAFALTLLLATPFYHLASISGWHGYALALLAIPALLVSGSAALALVNWLVTLTVRPDVLPRLDYSEGVPAHARTLVVVPTLLASTSDLEDLVEGLEVRFLANRDAHLHFALLTDFLDAQSETLPQDAPLLIHARELIDSLNAKYVGEADRFFLFHRPRRWNAAENTWMGQERKRGKIAELNALLRGTGQDHFALVVGETAILPQIRYVISLDTDTQLPRDAARQFVGAIAHPLNRAVYDARSGRVSSGYAILQPRVGISLPSTARSLYAQLFGSDAGIDPYTRTVSDVYQDLFREGSFIGKGIYEVDLFERALDGRFPHNRILSHDLVEGCYARSGLLSDVQLYEEYPARYVADATRRHRWIRGDWQLMFWASPWAPTEQHGVERNPLSALSRWKIADNLRRSLVPAALVVMLLSGWLGMADLASWTLLMLAFVFGPMALMALHAAGRKPGDLSVAQHLSVSLRAAWQQLARTVLTLAWLPHEAFYSLDAIARTLWRMLVSRRLLLQWNSSREVERTQNNELAGLYRTMWMGPALGVLTLAALAVLRISPAAALPLIVLWLGSPAAAWWVSRASSHAAFVPSAKDRVFLRILARKTWAFFDHHVGPENNWLPPDNMQEQPVAVVARRTSPTNIGLSLLAHLAAYDFGFLSGGRLLDRLDRTFATMVTLERHRQHFYNWYDTQTLKPLRPQYVSTVDSGNLAGHLLTLRPGLLALPDDPVFDMGQLDGLGDTLAILQEALRAAGSDEQAAEAMRAELRVTLARAPRSLEAALASLERLLARAREMAPMLDVRPDSDAEFWLHALVAQCVDLCEELNYFVLPSVRGGESRAGGHPSEITVQEAVPTWRELACIDAKAWPEATRERVAFVQRMAAERIATAMRLAQLAGELATMDLEFLYDARRHLLSIGYNVDERRVDTGFYDLLASEARLTSFVAIAQGLVPQEGWFSLGRLLTTTGGTPVLLSWTGSMFEYLMPMLVMPSLEGTLLEQTCRAAVARQIEYGHQLGLPWGVSESGYNLLDAQLNYQYRAFGVPGLGLKRGLGEDLVVAPYASALALMVAPDAACRNLQRLAAEGLAGRFGLHEAVDFTPARLPRGQTSVVVRSFMAHHQGMSLLALASVLLDQPMQRRFASDPQFQAAALLLQERLPKTASPYLHAAGLSDVDAAIRQPETQLRVFTDPDLHRPAVQLLSNGRYHVMVSSAGGGYSRCREIALTRWHEDITSDLFGAFCYLRDVVSGAFWSTAHQPTLRRPELYEAIFSDSRAEFRVRERDFDAHTEIVVSPEDDIELRRIHVTNRARTTRTIELTSYAEVVLAPAISDAMHPAFNKLFIQTELLRPLQAIVCTRRPRSSEEAVPWMFHLLAVHGTDIDSISYETDRARFIGRGRSLADPAAMDDRPVGRPQGRVGDGLDGEGQLSNSEGSVLDPIVAIRCRLTLEAGQSASVDFVTGLGASRDDCVQLIGKYRDRHLADRVFDLAWTHSQVSLRQLNTSLSDARLYEQMAASILYANASMRAEASLLAANQRSQSGLWGQAISGDLPIVLLQISESANIELVRQLVQAHAYWRLKGLAVDLVIWNEDHAGYRQHLQDLIMGLIASGVEATLIDRPGGIFVRPAQQLSREDRVLMQSVARIVVADTRGSLAEQLYRRRAETPLARFEPTRAGLGETPVARTVRFDPASSGLVLPNPYGGFSADGTEYVIGLEPGDATPAPWANVLANPGFGSVISESGGAYTWSENAHEYRLTPWHNDPVCDASGEAFYLRDEETGRYWSPTPLPIPGQGGYTTRHGFGYSVFEHEEDGIHSELWVYVALDAPIKFSVLKVYNRSGRPRRLSATGYVEWVLGDLRDKSAMHVVTEYDPLGGTLSAHNRYSIEFTEAVAFFDIDMPARSVTGDRTEFIGRNGNLRAPAAMSRARLSGRTGAGLDPCGAVQTVFELNDDDSHEIVFRLGAGRDADSTRDLVQRQRGALAAANALEAVRAHWQQTLGSVQIATPDVATNMLANGWLMYQVIACRLWARSGYYQSGGAFGFRDQLQDVMAMVHASPARVREHLLVSAAHQYPQGDVQHWWHPPIERGVRTQCSDDYLWLALATSRYVRVTGDRSVLDEPVAYLEGRPLNPGEESYYDLPTRSGLRETLYQHCVRAIEHASPRGAQGLPLIGSGDWNDGMNRVGDKGKGESVWLGFFLYEVLRDFACTAHEHGDSAFAERCETQARTLRDNLELHGWDGAWYRRAYFDDGTPLGSSANDECRIDSIVQSWSVLSGAAPDDRAREAMRSLDQHLVRRDVGLIQLLDPPFDHGTLDPGYIKGYVPGVRENGGQYTHAAVWATMAFAALGEGAQAWALLHMINPVNHTGSAAGIEIYKVEPYVVAADVYGVAPHAGRGGWSWYTGSAGWLYRLILESLLGLDVRGDRLRIEPVLPVEWAGFSMHYRFGETVYEIAVRQTAEGAGDERVSVDGVLQDDGEVRLLDDGGVHRIEIDRRHGGSARQ